MNPRTGLAKIGGAVLRDLTRYWDIDETDLSYQISKDAADGHRKALRAIEEGVDTVVGWRRRHGSYDRKRVGGSKWRWSLSPRGAQRFCPAFLKSR